MRTHMIPNAILSILVSCFVLLIFVNCYTSHAQDGLVNQPANTDSPASQTEPSPTAVSEPAAPDAPASVDTRESAEQLKADESINEDEAESRVWVEKLPKILRPDFSKQDTNRAPLMAFRRWAYQSKPFVPAFLFSLFIGLVGTSFFPKNITVAQECCMKSFWRSLGRAFLAITVLVIFIRILILLQVTVPLATVLVAVLQLAIISGLSVGISLLGDRIFCKTGLAKLSFMEEHPRWATFFRILIGSLLIALICQIPGIGRLPRIGIRIVVLIAILGLGGLLKTRFGNRSVSETSAVSERL